MKILRGESQFNIGYTAIQHQLLKSQATDYYLSKEDRIRILKKLNKKQKLAVNLAASFSYRSKIGNQLALFKATQEWDFYMVFDHGEITEHAKCLCGRSLRYEFILKNRRTNKLRSLGVSHFQQELNIPDPIARSIINNIHEINYHLDELLIKYSEGWELSREVKVAILEESLPEDIKMLLNINMPLLDTHLNKISEIMRTSIEQRRREFEREESLNKLIHFYKTVMQKPRTAKVQSILDQAHTYLETIYQTGQHSRLTISYIVVKDDNHFEVNTEINHTRGYSNHLRYQSNIIDSYWSTGSMAGGGFSSGRPLIGCIAKVERLMKNTTGILVFFGHMNLDDLQRKTQQVMRMANLTE